MTREKLAVQLKNHREKNLYSVTGIEKRTKLSKGQIYSIERGNSNYTIDSLLEYANDINLKILNL